MSFLHRALAVAFVVGLGLSITLSETALAFLALLLLWKLRSAEGRAAVRWPLAGPVVAFSAATLLSALSSGHPGASLAASKGLLLVAALYVTRDALDSGEDGERLLSGLSVVVAVAALVGLLQVGICPGQEPDYGFPSWLYHRCYRARAFFSIYMTLAGVLNLALLATLPRLLPGGGVGIGWLLPWLLSLAGLVVTYTRGAWIGFAAGVLSLVPAIRRGRWLLLIGLTALAGGALVAPGDLRHRFLTMADPHEAGVTERLYMWRSGLAMWREHPWLGMGPGGVKREYSNYALPEAAKKRTGHVHNTPLQILVERGVFGLAAWLWLFGAFYARTIGLLRRLAREAARERALVAGSLAAVTGFLVAGLTEYNFGDSEVALVAWAIMALPFVVEAGDTAPHPSPLPGGERER